MRCLRSGCSLGAVGLPGHGAYPRRIERKKKLPIFMDFHDDLKLPPEAVEAIARGAKEGETDPHGVRQLDLFYNDDGKVYCLLEAPDAEAVRRHHADLDLVCGDVHPVSSIR
jgi:hypothetical protein